MTVSDTRTAADDRSGDLIASRLGAAGHEVLRRELVPDEPPEIGALLVSLSRDPSVEVVVLNGGTGVAPRDGTYEAVVGCLSRRLDGFGELFRALSYEQIGAAAMLSRAVAGLIERTVVFSLPGSTAACELAMDRLVLPELGHLVGLAEKNG